MFSRWGAFVYRFRRPVAIIAVVLALASTVLASQASSVLSAGGWLDANSESAEVSARLDEEFGAGKSSVIALFRSTTPGADATSAEFQAAIATAPSRACPRCRRWRASWATPRPAIRASSARRATPRTSSSSST